MKRYAVIVAAGTGSRMQSELPKQFMLLAGKPVLYYSLRAFHRGEVPCEIVVVLAASEIERWQTLCKEHAIDLPHTIAMGGATRTDSVRNGLALTKDGLVAIHDGARPLISQSVIENCFQSAAFHGSGVACVRPKDSIRRVEGTSNFAEDREGFRLMQTPQTFQTKIILDAFAKNMQGSSTDDATVVENAGMPIHLVEGDYKNLKITTPEDLALAEVLLPSVFV